MAGPSIRHNRGLPIELINHVDLADMPDVGGINSDHDTRYYTQTQLNSIVAPSGASLIGVEDAGAFFVGADVEAVLQELMAVILPGDYLRLDGTNVPTANYVWTTNLTTTGTLQGGTLTDGTVIITGGAITGATYNGLTMGCAANVISITCGTTDLTVSVDCTINQDLSNTSSPTFDNLTVTSINGLTGIGCAGNVISLTCGTTDFTVSADCAINQNLNTTASPSFNNLNLSNRLTANQILHSGSTPNIGTEASPWAFIWGTNIDGTTITDGNLTINGGNITGMGNITGTDVDLSLGSGDITTTGTGTFSYVNITDEVNGYQIDGLRILSNEGSNNTFVGIGAGDNIGGTGNVAVGTLALNENTGGNNNVAIGRGALQHAYSNSNVALGTYAGQSITTGQRNFALGYVSLNQEDAGNDNIAIGNEALRYQDGGTHNLGIGSNTLRLNVAGDYNVGIGGNVLAKLNHTDADYNTAIGYGSGYNITTGASNVFLGYKAGYRQTTNSNLLIIDDRERASVAIELSNSIIYGVMAATPANQSLRINAEISATGDLIFVGSGSGLPFGECHQADGATFTVTMTTVNVWVEVDAATTNISAGELNLVTFPGDHYLLALKAGKYLVTYSFTAEINSVAGGDQHVESGVMVNGSIQTDKGIGHEQYAATNKQRNLQGHTIINVPANGQISLAIKNTTSSGKILTIDHLNITITQLGGT